MALISGIFVATIERMRYRNDQGVIGECREGTGGGGGGPPAYCFRPRKSSVQEQAPGLPEGLDSPLLLMKYNFPWLASISKDNTRS